MEELSLLEGIINLKDKYLILNESTKRSPEERRLVLAHIFSNLFIKDKKASSLLKNSPAVLAKRVQEI